jgi:hypothetical protein
MDPDRFKEAFGRLRMLDDHTYKLRPSRHGAARASLEQLEDRVREISTYTIELKEIVDDLFQSIAARPKGESEQS